jgi:hypothetical protein
MTTTFRDAAWRLSPPRLRTYRAARMVYAFIGVPLDAIARAADEATAARFPATCPPDALIYHGRDRGIRRGLNESAANYRARLLLWIQAWRGAGVGAAMLDQIAGYLTPKATRLRIWTQVGVIYSRAADGTFSIARVAPNLWNWDDEPSLWARFWVIIDSFAGVPWERDGTWGDGETWGEGPASGTWGSTATQEEVASIRAIVADWKPAAAVCKNIIVSFDADAFAADDASPPLPDGTWAHWSKNAAGDQVPARDDRAIYWDGVA